MVARPPRRAPAPRLPEVWHAGPAGGSLGLVSDETVPATRQALANVERKARALRDRIEEPGPVPDEVAGPALDAEQCLDELANALEEDNR